MNDVQLMQVSDSTDHLLEVLAGFVFLNFVFLYDVIEEFALFDVLHDQEKVARGLNDLRWWKKYLVQLDDTGVADEFEDVDFSGYSFDVGHVDDFFLDEDFDGYFFAC